MSPQKHLLILGALASLFVQAAPAIALTDAAGSDRITALAADPDPNAIERAELAMLRRRYGSSSQGGDIGMQEPFNTWGAASNLQVDRLGGFGAATDVDGVVGIDLLTGSRAVEESLQLGSIGTNRGPQEAATIPLSVLKAVETKSHDFAAMIKDERLSVTVPAIAHVIPADAFAVHFQHPAAYRDLYAAATDGMPLSAVPLPPLSALEGLVAKRLGIPDPQAFLAQVEEFAFVAEDLSFLDGTDFALVVRYKAGGASALAAALTQNTGRAGTVGGYGVFASHETLFARIQGAQAAKAPALAAELDYQYALGVLDARRDGMVYLSDRFIRTLTGPAYRIGARRRATVLEALETLQYVTYAYRSLEGAWPAGLEEIARKGYIDLAALADPGSYTIGGDGAVRHAVWGTVFDATPVRRVTVTTITAAERELYETFVEQYQSFYREFFDPIGVAIMVADQISLHTVILPLIDNSQYNMLRTMFGTVDKGSFRLIDDPRRGAAAQSAFALDMDNVLAVIGEGFDGAAEDAEAAPSVAQDAAAKRAAAIAKLENELKQDLGLEWEGRIFDFVGDELLVGIGKENTFDSIADIDVFVGLALRDRAKAERFFTSLMRALAEEFSGGGMFSLSKSGALKNSYNGVEYSTVPTGLINLFYVFFDDRMYFTASQVAMNRVIDREGAKEPVSPAVQRGLDFVGGHNDALAQLDLAQMASWTDSLAISDDYEEETLRAQARYLDETLTLAKILPGADGTLANVAGVYASTPTRFFDWEIQVAAGEAWLVKGAERVKLTDVLPAGPGTPYGNRTDRPAALDAFLKKVDARASLKDLAGRFENLALGFNLTEHGVEIRVSAHNPSDRAKDGRFASTAARDAGTRTRAVAGTVALAVLIAAGVAFGLSRRR